MKETLLELIAELEPFLNELGFKKKGKTDFVIKRKEDFGREEKLAFTARAHRNDSKAIYVSCTIGIYYADVRKKEKIFVEDFINEYPIVAGSISHFSPSNSLLSILYIPGENKTEVLDEIKNEIKNGALHLINLFPDLNSIYTGIKDKHPYLDKFYKFYDERSLITVLTIVLCLFDKKEAKAWLLKNFNDGEMKSFLLKKVESL